MDVANKYNMEQSEVTEEHIQYVLKLKARQTKQYLVKATYVCIDNIYTHNT